ncbi:MAG: pitrilysin family protein [Gemmatimonadaceae bacterium]
MSETLRPPAGSPRHYAFPDVERHELSNELTLHVASLKRLPAVTALFMVDAGAECDPVPKAGVAALTVEALSEGTRGHDADELASAFERLGGSLETDITWNRAECSTTVLTPRFAEALRLLGEVVTTPVFPAHDVDRLRDERLAELLQQRAEPRGLADDMFALLVHPPSHRYALPEGGDEHTVAPLSAEDVRSHHGLFYTPPCSALIVAGDVKAEEVRALAEDVFGRWRVNGGSAPEIPVCSAEETRGIHLVAKPDAPQSELRIGHLSVPRLHPDFYALIVMNSVLGGLFNSRINLNLREENAFTYGAFSMFDWKRFGSTWSVSTAVESHVTAAAVKEVLVEIDRMRQSRVDPAELSLAVDYLTGVFPIRFETTAAIADAIATREANGLERNYYDTYRERVAAVSADEVLSVAQRHLDPARLQIVAVSDAQAVRGSLEALHLGPVHVRNAAGEPVA